MFMKVTKQFGKPVCVALYTFFGMLAMKKKPLPFLLLLGLHAGEYVLIGRKLAQEKGLTRAEGVTQCLSFGFTWWLPLKKDAV